MLDRNWIETVLVAHQRKDIGSCICGWNELGKSFAGHQADMILAPFPIIHACPPDREGRMPCCGKIPFDCPGDRMTINLADVTCRG